MRKIAWLLLAVLLVSMLFTGCGKNAGETAQPTDAAQENAADVNPVDLYLPLVTNTALLDPMLQELYPDLKPGSWDFAVTRGGEDPELTARYREDGGDWYIVQLRVVSGRVYALNTKQLKAEYPISETYRQSDRFYYLCSVPTEKGTGFYEDNVPKEDAEAGMEIKPVIFREQGEMLTKLNSGLPLELQLDYGDPVPYQDLVK